MVKYLVKQNEKQQIQIINVLIDYYFTYGINNNKNASDLNNINALNDQTTATKSIIDLICRIPDDFANVTQIFIFYK